MGSRLQLQTMLETLVADNFIKATVYFQPPESVKLSYPCIIYKRERHNTKFADDKPYSDRIGYIVTVIDKNPDSLLPGKISELPMCSFDRNYTADNLNHDVFILYY